MAVEIRSQRQSHRFHSMEMLSSDGGGGRSGDVYINVTALVDMMTVLVIFLVMNFNASGELLFVKNESMAAPVAEHGEDITRVPIVSLDRRGDLYFEGSMIVADLNSRAGDGDMRIAELEEKLVDNRKRVEVIGQRDWNSPEEDPTTTVNVQVDKEVDFKLLKRVLHTCELAGYVRARLAVGDERKGSAPEGEGHGGE